MPTPAPSLFDQQMAMPGNRIRADLFRQAALLVLGAGGLGAAFRGAQGLGDLWHSAVTPPERIPLRQQVVSVPVPRPRDEPEKRAGLPPRGPFTDLVGRAMHFFGGLKLPDGANWGPGKDLLWNYGARSLKELPLAYMAGVPAAAAAAGLGYKGVDRLLHGAQARETDSELEAARRQYEAALAGKEAAAGTGAGAGALDRLAEKAGAQGYGLSSLLAPVVGLGGLGLVGTAALAGAGTYNWTRSHAADRVLAEALRRRRARLFAEGPPPLLAVPEEVEAADPGPDHGPGRDPGRAKAAGAGAVAPVPGSPNTAQAAQAALQQLDADRQAQAARTAALLGLTPPARPAGKPAAAAGPPPLPSVARR